MRRVVVLTRNQANTMNTATDKYARKDWTGKTQVPESNQRPDYHAIMVLISDIYPDIYPQAIAPAAGYTSFCWR